MASLNLIVPHRSPIQQIARQLAQDIEEHTEAFLAYLQRARSRALDAYVDIEDDVNRIDDTLQDIIGRLMKVTP